MRILKFEASWCGPCRALRATFIKMKDYLDSKNIKVENIDIEDNDDLVEKYNIRSVPTIIFIKNEKEVNRTIGAIGQDKIKSIIEENE